MPGGRGWPLALVPQLQDNKQRDRWEGMRLGSLKAKYRKEYGELRAKRQGQGELL